MTEQSSTPVKEPTHIAIPKISSISGRVKVHNNDSAGRALWANGGSILVFVMAFSLFALPLFILALLLRQPDTGPNGLTWVWIVMGVITESIAILAGYGLIRSVLETER